MTTSGDLGAAQGATEADLSVLLAIAANMDLRGELAERLPSVIEYMTLIQRSWQANGVGEHHTDMLGTLLLTAQWWLNGVHRDDQPLRERIAQDIEALIGPQVALDFLTHTERAWWENARAQAARTARAIPAVNETRGESS